MSWQIRQDSKGYSMNTGCKSRLSEPESMRSLLNMRKRAIDLLSLGSRKSPASQNVAFGMKSGLLLASLLMLSSLSAYAEIDLGAISMIESSGGKNLVGDGRKSFGVYQINVNGALADYRKYVDKVSKKDLMNPEVNREIADWYINRRIPLMLRFFKKPVTNRNILIAYNAGIAYVAHEKDLPETTLEYLLKYEALTGEAL